MMKKGASLIWAVVISTALLFISVTTANFVIKESQMSIRMDDSSRAYAAAESGIEWGKYCIKSQAECTSIPTDGESTFGPFNLGEGQYVVTVSKPGGKTTVESLGTSGGVNRKLEYVSTSISNQQIVADPKSGTFTIAGSYVQQFDYWTNGSGFGNIGVSNGLGDKAIYFEHTSTGIRMVAVNGATSEISEQVIGSDATGLISSPYALRVRIEYFKDLSAKMTISKRDPITKLYNCVSGPLVVDMRAIGISSIELTKFYYSVLPVVSTAGDGTSYSLTTGTGVAYFDNMATIGMVHTAPAPLKYALTTGPLIPGRGTVTVTTVPVGVSPYDKGTKITLKAIPSGSYVFREWTGTNCPSAPNKTNPLTFTINANTTCLAGFYAN